MDTAERYRELLDAFRDAHSKLKATPFALDVCHWAEAPRITRGEPWNTYLKNCVLVLDKSPGEVMPVGLLAFPVVDPNWLTYAILANPRSDDMVARQCGDEIMQMPWRTCVVYAKTFGDKQQKAVDEFVRLANNAGQELPLFVRETIPRQANVADGEPNEFANRWLALMFWSNPPELDELLRLNQWGGGQTLFWQPFSNSADIIERCRLATGSAAFHTKGDHWPHWAGQIPQSLLLQVEAELTPNAKRFEPLRTLQQATKAAGDGGGKADDAEFVFCPDGDGYFIRGFGEHGHITATGASGLHDIFRLVQSDNGMVPMLELDAGAGTKRLGGDLRARQPSANQQTRHDIAVKRKQLQADIADADSEVERVELQMELETLETEAAKLFGLDGKARDLNNPNDKLRPKIHGRIQSACDKLAKCQPKPFPNVADHFRGAIGAEGACMKYSPGIPNLRWQTESKV